MGTYVIGDIHGCYDALQNMLSIINLQNDDRIVFVGDYIDYGAQNYKVLKWLDNLDGIDDSIDITFIKGDRDLKFIATADLLLNTCNVKNWRIYSLEDTKKTYKLLSRMMKVSNTDFDEYHLFDTLIFDNYLTIEELNYYAQIFRSMTLGLKFFIDNKTHVVTHAGYLPRSTKEFFGHETREHFCSYAHEEAFINGGCKHGVVISGHNPTTKEGFFNTNGLIFQYYNSNNDCRFYDIDCGCGLGNENKNAKLACIRLEDKNTYYI